MNEENSNIKKYWLRKLRRGVSLRFNGYDKDGIPQWILYDPSRNSYYIVGWPEHEMLSRWDLADPQAIIDAVNKETTLHIDMKDFENLESFLYKNYLVEQRWRSIYGKAKEQKLIKSENIVYWFLKYYLFFRVPIFHPDEFLNRTKKLADFLFSRYTLYFMCFLGIIAIYQISTRWEDFTHTFASIFSWQGLVSYIIAFTVIKVFHELGHAYMSKQYGVSVPTMGVAFLVFWPVFYTDTTQSWSLPPHQRLRIALAGMWVETYCTIIAALIWSNVHNTTVQMICYVTVAINWVSTLLINVSPFMRFDGYYVLSDILNTPNLQPRSFALARSQIRKWLFGWEDPDQEQFSKHMHRILVGYAIITWIYRLFIYFGIAVIVYHYFFKIVGIMLFLLEVFLFIVRPLVLEFASWYNLRSQFTLNKRTITSLTFSVIIISLLVIPINRSLKMNATLSYAHQILYAPQDALVQGKMPEIGSHVKAQEIIIELKSPELDYNLKKTQLEYNQIELELRRAYFDPNHTKEINFLKAKLATKEEEYMKLKKQQEKLIIRAPFDGTIGDIVPNLQAGVILMKDSWILNIVDTSKLIIEAYIDQSDRDFLTLGTTGYFYPLNLEKSPIPVKVVTIEAANSKQLAWHFSKRTKDSEKEELNVDTPSYHASDFGGNIPTTLSSTGEIVPVDSVYRVLLISEKKIDLKEIELGTVILKSEPRSFISQLIYKIKKAISNESGF